MKIIRRSVILGLLLAVGVSTLRAQVNNQNGQLNNNGFGGGGMPGPGMIPRVFVSPSAYGLGGLRGVTVRTPTQSHHEIVRYYFAPYVRPR
jgi:hypothetical protein